MPSGFSLLTIVTSFLLFLSQVSALDTIAIESPNQQSTRSEERNAWGVQDKDRTRAELPKYEPEFSTIARSIIGRVDDEPNIELKNNIPGRNQLSPGEKDYWVFPLTELYGHCSNDTRIMPRGEGPWPCVDGNANRAELKRRGSDRYLYITLSVCNQPTPSNNNVLEPPPPLKAFISWTQPKPGSAADPNTRDMEITEGFGEFRNPMSNHLFIGVEAVLNSSYSGKYGYELTGSIDALYSYYQDNESLYHVDSDYQSSFFVSSNLTESSNNNDPYMQEYMANVPPFSLFIHNQNDTRIMGMRRSYCALNSSTTGDSQNHSVTTTMTRIGGGAAKQQFYVSGLNKSSSYYAIMALATNVTDKGDGHPTGGGMVWKSVQFTTTSSKHLNS